MCIRDRPGGGHRVGEIRWGGARVADHETGHETGRVRRQVRCRSAESGPDLARGPGCDGGVLDDLGRPGGAQHRNRVLPRLGRRETAFRDDPLPVSYTHLDVYKRQGWYTLSGGEGDDSAEKRLTRYLQEQYLDRVLDSVAEEINPEVVREDVLTLYIRPLGQQLKGIRRYYVPYTQLDVYKLQPQCS